MGVVREDVVKFGFDIDFAELTRLTSALDDTKAMLTSGIGDDAFDEMVKESKKATEGIEDVKDSIKGIKPDGIDDVAKGLKDTDKEGEDAHKQLKKIAQTSFNKTVSGLKKVVGTLGKVGLAAGKVLAKGIAAGAVGVGALVGKSVSNFADYQQLTGGVETLFGTGGQSLKEYAAAAGKSVLGAQKEYNSLIFAQNTVMKNAKGAYKTAGLSANDYMETVTSFSASLIQSLGGDTKKAAEYAHTAIVDMSDNANKMGTDMSSIQDAYQGFAKQNYTMLDNLKLGYGGTKEEMSRLLKDASKISGIKYDISSYADVVQAIHVIQEEMGIAGTTSKEASETISGSFSSMKAAWDNTLTSLIVGGDDFDECVDNLIESAKTFGKNIMPAITKALSGVGSLIEELAPIIEKELPGIIDTLLPPLIKAATSLLKGLIIALPDIISTLIDEIPTVLAEVWSAMKEAFGDIPGIDKAEAFFGKIGKWFSEHSETIKKLVPAVLGLVGAFKLFNKLKGLTGLFGGSGGGSGKGGGFFGSLAKMKPTTVLKGMGNLAIILGGLGILAAVLMWVAPYMAKLSDLKSIGEVLLVISAVGLIGTGLTKLAGSVGMIPVATVAKGLANIAIVMVGFGALAAVLMWLAPYMAQLSDLKTTFKILAVIGAVGLVGAALAGLAGIVGLIPTAVVLAGLANIALVLGGFAGIATAFGALSKVDGFTELMNTGGQVLADLCRIIGDMAGSLIGGFAEGVTDSLPAIGENLSAFATSLQPMFDTFAGVDASGLSDFAGALAAFIAVIAGEKIVSVITGGIDYADLGNKLSTMATSLSTFFTTIMTFPDGAFEKAAALFNCLAGISSMPKEGGVVGWFEGEVDYTKMATGLNAIAGAAGAFTTIQTIPDEAFTKMSSLFNCLAGISSLPKDGGVVGWFQGEVNFENIASGIQSLASAGMVTALTTLSTIPEAAFTGLSGLFEALAGIKAMPKEGGIAGWFGGDASTGLTNVASQLPGVATNIASFFTNLGGRTDFTPIKSLFDTLSSINIDSEAADKGFLGLGSSQLESMGTGLSNFATNAAAFFSKINELNVENMKTFFSELSTVSDLPETLTGIDGTLGTTLANIVTTVETGMTDAKTAVETGLTACCDAITGKVKSFYTSGASIMQGLNLGMLSKKATLMNTAHNIATSISKTINDAMDINSPSKVTMTQGKFVGSGLAVGMEKSIPDIKDVALKVSDASLPYSGRYRPESDGGIVYNNGGNSDYTSIAPQFNLTISGTQDDRATARKVKRWVNEAIKETFESMERKNHVLREV